MALPKLYNPIVFDNNTTPALNEDNLNEMSESLSEIDDRIIMLAGDVVEKAAQIIELGENPPYIGENGNWYTWNTSTGAYADSGIDASITVTIQDATALDPDATPYVTNTGTNTDPVFHLFIPRGQPGAPGTTTYSELTDKPSINGTALNGAREGIAYDLVDGRVEGLHVINGSRATTDMKKGEFVYNLQEIINPIFRLTADVSSGQSWTASTVSVHSISDDTDTRIDAEVITRASLGAHNLNGTRYISKAASGLTWTVNEDGSVSVTGTAGGDIVNGESFIAPISAQVILTGGIADNAHVFPWDETDNARPYTDSTKTTRQSGNVNATNSASFYMEKGHLYRMTLRVNAGYQVNGTFKPMICLATDADDTYRSYTMTNKQLMDNKVGWDSNTLIGAHNLLRNDAKAQTKNGVIFTLNTEKVITASTGSGGATANTIIGINTYLQLQKGDYILSSELHASNYYLSLEAYNGSTWVKALGDTKTGDVKFTVDYVGYDHLRVYLAISSGAIYTTPTSIYPMIRLASDTDATYKPYAKTNKQLTDNVKDIETAIAPIEIGTASQAYDKGDYLIMNDTLYKVTQAIVSGATLTVGTNIVQTSVAEELELNNTQLELTGISTNKGIIEGVFTNVIPLLTRDLMKCSGVVKVPGANSFGFNVFRISSTMYYGFFHANDRVFTAVSSSGTVTAYQIVGTAI